MSSRKIASWTIGVMILGTGIWCLYLAAKSAFFTLSPSGINGMPIDMRIMSMVSTGVAIIFSCLFLLSGVSSILRSKEMQINYYPTLLKVTTLLVLIVLSVLALSEYRATSKISWEESRGLPFAFLASTEIRGLCNTGIVFWECRSINNLNLLAFIMDVLMIYFVVCIAAQTLFELSTLSPKKRLFTNSSEIKVKGG